jgi:hypothetical protein
MPTKLPIVSPGNVMFWSAVAQSHAKFFFFIERVRGMRNTSSMGTTKKSLAQTHPGCSFSLGATIGKEQNRDEQEVLK